MKWLLCSLLLLSATRAAAPQAPERRAAFGEVVGLDGKPVADAEVTCLGSSVLPVLADELGQVREVADVVRTTSDARGRFTVKLLIGREYCAWAATPVDGDGRFRVGPITYGLRASGAARLLQSGEQRARQRITLAGADAWLACGPLRLAYAVVGRHLMPIDPGAQELPPMPMVMRFVVDDANGEVLWDGGDDGWQRLPPEQRSIPVPPPTTITLRAEDAAQTPVADAEVWLLFDVPGESEDWAEVFVPRFARRLGTTDAAGSWSGVVPALDPSLGLHLLVRKPGWRWATVGIRFGGPYYQGLRTHPTPEPLLFTAVLQPVQKLVVRPERSRVAEVMSSLDWGGTTVPLRVPVRSEAGGAVSLPVAVEQRRQLLVQLPPEEGQPGALLQLHQDKNRQPDELLFDVADARRIDVDVRDSNGNPARRARLLVLPAAEWGWPRGVPIELNAAGRGIVCVGPGAWLLFACDGEQAAWKLFTADAGAGVCRVDLATIPSLTVRVVDVLRQPRAQLDCQVIIALQDVAPVPAPANYLHPIARTMWRAARSQRLDQDGVVRIPVLLPEASVQMMVMEGTRGASGQGKAGQTIELQLPRQ